MSIKCMTWVWENGPDHPTERLVLLAIADFSDDRGVGWPSLSRVAEKSCVAERSARRIVRRLEEGGWLHTEIGGGRGGSSRYTVKMDRQKNQDSMSSPEQNPDSRDTKPGLSRHKTRTQESAEPSRTVKEPPIRDDDLFKSTEKPAKQTPEDEAISILAERVPLSLAKEFAEHRRYVKAKLTPLAARKILKEINGSDASACLEKSIANGWRGVFAQRPEKPRNEGPKALWQIEAERSSGGSGPQ